METKHVKHIFMQLMSLKLQAMAKDRRNYYQDTPKQIKRKITSFKSTPNQYSAYLKLKGENKLDTL
jgi:hypothetical protein